MVTHHCVKLGRYVCIYPIDTISIIQITRLAYSEVISASIKSSLAGI